MDNPKTLTQNWIGTSNNHSGKCHNKCNTIREERPINYRYYLKEDQNNKNMNPFQTNIRCQGEQSRRCGGSKIEHKSDGKEEKQEAQITKINENPRDNINTNHT